MSEVSYVYLNRRGAPLLIGYRISEEIGGRLSAQICRIGESFGEYTGACGGAEEDDGDIIDVLNCEITHL